MVLLSCKRYTIYQKPEHAKKDKNMGSNKRRSNNIIKIKKHPFGGNYLAINLFGFIFTLRDLNKVELNHELIHSAQQKELLYLPFFIWYGIEWAVLYLKYKNWTKAYYHIRFEREAYHYEYHLDYLKRRKHFNYVSFKRKSSRV